MDLARDTSGRVLGAGLTFRLKPTKTDVTGESGAVRTFVLDEKPHFLSAAAAIWDMLKPIPRWGRARKCLFLETSKQGKS